MVVFIIGWILLSANPNRITTSAQSLSTSTNTPLLEGNVACPGQQVTFICQTTGTLAWSSNEYIGTGGSLITYGFGDVIGDRSRMDINSNVYAILTDISGSNYTSELHITAYLSSSLTCIAEDHSKQNATLYLRILDVPDVPEDPVAIQIRDMRYGRCFIPIMWKNTVNSVEARVTYYTLRVNGNFVSTETANLSSTVYYSKFLVTECANSHTIDISATNICGTTGRIIYRTHRQDQQCPTDTDTSTCIETEIPTLPPTVPTTVFTRIVSGTRPNGYSERNRGNFHLIVACGVVVATTFFLGSL